MTSRTLPGGDGRRSSDTATPRDGILERPQREHDDGEDDVAAGEANEARTADVNSEVGQRRGPKRRRDEDIERTANAKRGHRAKEKQYDG